MASTQQVAGPTGKLKNCNTWASYERRGQSPTAAMCHGGYYDGDHFAPCPSAADCKRATDTEEARERLTQERLVQIGGNKYSRGSSLMRPYEPMSNALPARPVQTHSAIPTPVIPPEEYPEAMRTPFIAPTHTQGVTPTFLPEGAESGVERLGKNIVQGWIGSSGWHIFDFLRSVDIFRKRRPAPRHDADHQA